MVNFKLLIGFFVLITSSFNVNAQGFLRAEGKKIVNDGGEIILRGHSPGGWLLQEGYMLKTEGFANAEYQIRNKIEALIGKEKKDAFYEEWYANHFTKKDVDSIAAWGFNSIRVPLHYKLFTLPIEEEPVQGENTWLTRGFEILDELLGWCIENELYLTLDLHAAPGGQGKDAAISDYDPSKPSLWESQENKNKTIALWRKLAERYKDEQWIGGFDLINEVNWTFSGSNNAPMWDLYRDIAEAIREVNPNHIIFIGGNWWGNDYTGLTAPFDNNLVYSFHKYWSYNDIGSIQWMLDLRNNHNVPIWCGEAGENSNSWYTSAISLLENNGIGWAWWAWKKFETITGPLSVPITDEYNQLLSFWNAGGTNPVGSITAEFAENALWGMLDNIKIENCKIRKDVVDALIRQVSTTETKPFTEHFIPGLIYATDFDLGRLGYAYYDTDTATYHVNTGTYTAWNTGWSYRNDGVDIQQSEDNLNSNGYNVGWVNSGEWMKYTVNIDSTAAYRLKVRHAGIYSNTRVSFDLDGFDVTNMIDLPSSPGWQTWRTTEFEKLLLLPEGKHTLRFKNHTGGANLSFFEFEPVGSSILIDFEVVSGSLLNDGTTIQIALSKKIDTLWEANFGGFSVKVNDSNVQIDSAQVYSQSSRVLNLYLNNVLSWNDVITLSYSGGNVFSFDGQQLTNFNNLIIANLLPERHMIPGRIQAEDWHYQEGLSLEVTSDAGGGYNFGYTNAGDFADYLVTVQQEGSYKLNLRVASTNSNGVLRVSFIDEQNPDDVINVTSFNIPSTGGWQTWQTISKTVNIPKGHYKLRLYIVAPEFNVNWIEFQTPTSIPAVLAAEQQVVIYPNPSSSTLNILYKSSEDILNGHIYITDISGRVVMKKPIVFNDNILSVDVSSMSIGWYYITILTDRKILSVPLIIAR
jgi:endoglucanase